MNFDENEKKIICLLFLKKSVENLSTNKQTKVTDFLQIFCYYLKYLSMN